MRSLDLLFGAEYQIEWIKKSGYSELYCVVVNEEKLVAKKIRADLFAANGFYKLAQEVNTRTSIFNELLRERSVPVPRRYETRIVNGEVWHLSTYEGLDFHEQLSGNGGENVQDRMATILEAILGVILQEHPQVGIDPRLSNFAGNGKPIYIDMFPPLLALGGQLHVHFPNPAGHQAVAVEFERKFTMEGILRRLRFEFMAINPAWGSKFEEVVYDILPCELYDRVGKFFQSLPDNIFPASREKLEKVIDSLIPDQIDEMRSLAARLIPLGADRARMMYEVFILTSSYTTAGYPESQQERLAQFRQMLKGCF